MGYYVAIQGNEALTYVTRMNVKEMMLKERSWTQKVTLYDSTDVERPEWASPQGHNADVVSGSGGLEAGGVTANGDRVSFWATEVF